MWIVRYALRYRYTIGVMAILIFLFGGLTMRRMSTDILPTVDTPQITLVWTYGGLPAGEMAAKITSFSEIGTLNNVDDLLEVRSETSTGVAIVRLSFQPSADLNRALAQVTAVSQTILRRMPPGTVPPLIVRSSPSSVPILQLVLSSPTLTDGALTDWARVQLRAMIQSIPGIRLSLPYGGAPRQIMIDLDPSALSAHGLSAADVNRALSAQNLTLPSGTLRSGGEERVVSVTASPESIAAFMDLPLRSVDGRTIYLRDVAHVRDGEAVSNNTVRLNGQNAVMVTVLKLGNASTVDVVRGILGRMSTIRAAAPEGMNIEPIFDQSVFVLAAIDSVLKEILLVGALVAFVVLLFLGSWRSTLIVLTSIPLALLCSVIGLGLTGATFNLMTLGGLALAIGILVDNALVEIENIKRQIALGKPVQQAILDGAQQVAFPEFVSTLGICIVFLPIFQLSGAAAYVFTPLALAVIFAMAASYLLSRTLVPTLASLLLPHEAEVERSAADLPPRGWRALHHRVENGLDHLATRQGDMLRTLLGRVWILPIAGLAVIALGVAALVGGGKEFFPTTDAGLMRLFVRLPEGTRLEESARKFADIHREIRALVPPWELNFVVENIGAHAAVNLAWVESAAVGPYDGEILVQLDGDHAPTADYIAKVRVMLREKFPEARTFFRPADTTAQTLSDGASSTLEVRFIGRDVPGNLTLARELVDRLGKIRGAVDVTLREVLAQPEWFVRIDRTRALQAGVTPLEANQTVLAALGSAGTLATNVWADPAIGLSYDVQVIAPPAEFNSVEQILNLPVRTANGGTVALRAFATVTEQTRPASISRTTLLPTFTVVANVQDRDLGGVTDDLNPILGELRGKQKAANRIEVAGQAALMESSYREMLGGLALAAVMVFLVMVVNFQSWVLPLVAMSGLPFALAGAFSFLWLTGTPLSVPALMGVIMVVGVSTANSVLVTSFARDRQLDGLEARPAALDAAATRLRPVIMTALAMILGVIPMALGLGEGGEQNAPLGRAVIGGLLFGTCATLFVVPAVFALARRTWRPAPHEAAPLPGAPAQAPLPHSSSLSAPNSPSP